MTPEELERFAALERRVAELEARLNRSESAPAPPPFPKPSPRPIAASAPPPPPLSQPAPASPPRSDIGTAWLSRIAAVTVILALAFFFDYAFQNHWIGETARVLLGIICGAAAIAIGDRLWRKGQPAFGQSLAAAGIAFFYLSFWAAFALYHLVPQPVAFVLMLLATAAAGALAFRYNGPVVAAIGLAGGYATPLLLAGTDRPWFVLGYALLLNAGGIFAARRRPWRWLEALAVAGSAVLYIGAGNQAADRALFTAFLAACLALFLSSPWLPIPAAADILGAVALAFLWSPQSSALLAALLCAAAALGVTMRRDAPLLPPAAFAAFWAAYLVWNGSAENPAPAAPLASAIAAFLLFLPWPLRPGTRITVPGLVLLPLNAAAFFSAAYGLLNSSHAALLAVLTAAAYLAVARLLWSRSPVAAQLAAGTACVLLVLAAPLQFAGYPVTLAWSLEGAAIAWIGSRIPATARPATFAALILFGFVFLHLVIDAGTQPHALLVNSRFLDFAVAAAALWASALWIASPRPAAGCWIAGHAVMLWGLSLETLSWSSRSAAPENLRSLSSASLSVVAAAYALILVATGAIRRHDLTRLLGVALIALVVIKLYLYDVWFLAALYRMVAFAILGLLLLVISYVYSRFRGSIQSWWRP